MHFLLAPIPSLVAGIFFASAADASYLNNEQSFGHHEKISIDKHHIPNWNLVGSPYPPELLSNKLVLTPPAPGNQRGGIWADKSFQYKYWTVDVDFRATGPERGTGNMNIWYVKDGQTTVGVKSIYTVGKFDGLALVIDQYAGSAGFIRGFLNDGTKEYNNHHSVDSLAFGHCDYSYRNLGRPSRIAISESNEGFKVTVDGEHCFGSSRIKLPIGNDFGITAATAENPDSFEVFKFVTTTESHTPDGDTGNPIVESHQNVGDHEQQTLHQMERKDTGDIPTYSDPPEAPASNFKTSNDQFADLHNRLQSMMKHISALNRDMTLHQGQYIHKQDDILTSLMHINERLTHLEYTVGKINDLEVKMERVVTDISENVRQTESALHHNIDRSILHLREDVTGTHKTLHEHVSRLPGLGKLLMIVVASQFMLVVAYVIYKKRKGRSHKKYL